MNRSDLGTRHETIRDPSDWHRFVIAVCGFLILESVLIIAFGSSIYGDPDPKRVADPDGMSSTVWFTLVLFGYFLLGLIGRSWWVLLAAFLPIVIALPVGIPSGAYEFREPLPLFLLWGIAMIYFVPVCAVGVGISKWVTRRLRIRSEHESNQVG